MMSIPAQQQFSSFPLTTIYQGHMGVAIFFVLSGFLLANPFWNSLSNRQPMPSLRHYAIRRLARIAPGYWVCVAITALLAGALSSRWEWIAFALTGSFLNWIFAATYMPAFNRPLWSVSVEMVFYVLLPMTVWLMFKCRSMVGAASAVIASIVLIIAGQHYFLHVGAVHLDRLISDRALFDPSMESWATLQNPLALYAHFLVGVIAACIHQSLSNSKAVATQSKQWAADLMVIVIIFGLLLCEGDVGRYLPVMSEMSYGFPFFPAAIGLLLILLPRSIAVGPALDNRPLRLTAKWSFGIYLWHVPLIHGTASAFQLTEQSTLWPVLLFVSAVLISVYFVAGLSYHWIESPAIGWERKVTRPAFEANHLRH